MSHTSIEIEGRTIHIQEVPDDPDQHGCANCVGRAGFAVCGSLPDGCSTQHVHYEEAK